MAWIGGTTLLRLFQLVEGVVGSALSHNPKPLALAGGVLTVLTSLTDRIGIGQGGVSPGRGRVGELAAAKPARLLRRLSPPGVPVAL